jgi:orotate phosphoribosyltransferase
MATAWPADLGAASIEDIFAAAGALQSGHFRLKSGLHSGRYLEKFAVLQYPALATELCRRLAVALEDHQPDVVVGPTTGGVLLAYGTARWLEDRSGRRVRGLFAEPVERGIRALRRGFTVTDAERIVLVDDILTTGESLRETVSAVTTAGGQPLAAAVLVDRSGGQAALPIPVHALSALDIPTWSAPACPLCATGSEATAPGSSAP